jgi:thiamine-monophosphate kinase
VNKVKLRDLGERKAVKLLRDILSNKSIDITSMEDDCAVIDFGDEYLLVTTDMITQQAHIPEKTTPWQVGWHVVAINLSDIAGMGGEPLGLVVALGLSSNQDIKYLEGIAEGMNSCASNFGTSILGGDTKEAETLTLSGCAFGRVDRDKIMLRKGAKPEDLVAVTGKLGNGGSAYQSLKNDMNIEKAIKDLMEVYPRVKEGIALSKTKVVSSCMDISDGLASSIYQLSNLNELGFKLDLSQIPISNEAKAISMKLGMSDEELALYFGGDYELLITLKKEGLNTAQEALDEIGTELTPIGEVIKEKKNILIRDGVSTLLEDRGYEHFRWKS